MDEDVKREVKEAVDATAKAIQTKDVGDALKAAKEGTEAAYVAYGKGWTWKEIVLVVVMALIGSGGTTLVMGRRADPEPVPVVDLGKQIADGFAGLGKQLDGISAKLDVKPIPPVPVDPDKPKPLPTKPITLPVSVETTVGGKLVRIAAKALGEVTWLIPPQSGIDVHPSGDVAILTALADGEYYVGALTVVGGKACAPEWCKVIVGKAPQPPPAPNPPQPEPPAPKVDSLSIVVVWESTDSKEWVKGVIGDIAFWRSVPAKWYKIDKDQKDADGGLIIDSHHYRQYMDKHGLPTILYMDKTGLVVRAMPLPSTTAAIRATITELTGK